MATDTAPKKGSVQKWENGFEIERLHVGKPDGKLAKPGKKVIVKYKGTLSSGKVFDETKGNKTFSFRLGMCDDTTLRPCTPLQFSIDRDVEVGHLCYKGTKFLLSKFPRTSL